jgi:hypothetical protein
VSDWSNHFVYPVAIPRPNSPDIALKNPENYALYFGEDNRRLGFLKPKCDGNILPVGFSYANGSPL